MPNQLISSARATAERIVAIITQKNKDYAAEGDPYKNFRASSVLGLGVEQAILVRTLDKIVRINNLTTHDNFVTEESLEDSIDDVIGYMLILRAYRETLKCSHATTTETQSAKSTSIDAALVLMTPSMKEQL